jgi:hypothetical protein
VIFITLGVTACRLIITKYFAKILAMTNKNETWFKWDYVCPNCDSHIVMTIKSNGLPQSDMCPKCMTDIQMILMSVVDVTIDPTTKKEEQMDISTEYNPNLLVTYKKIENNETTYQTDKVNDIEWKLREARQLKSDTLNFNNKLITLHNIIIDAYDNSNDQDTLASIADLFNLELTKEIEFSATIEVNGVMRVPLTDSYDLETMLNDELSVSTYGADVDVNDYSVFEVNGKY